MDFQAISLDELPVNDKPAGNYDPVPPGAYSASITSAEARLTKDGSGQYIKVRYDITGPSHVGRVVFSNINIRNNSAEAERIGRAQLGDLMRACGLRQLTSPEQLIGAQVEIQVAIKPARGEYPASNEVKGIKGSGTPSFAADIPAAPKPAAAKAAPPWAKK
jgi:hypothetical protein